MTGMKNEALEPEIICIARRGSQDEVANRKSTWQIAIRKSTWQIANLPGKSQFANLPGSPLPYRLIKDDPRGNGDIQ